MRIRIHGATPRNGGSGDNICKRCKYAVITRQDHGEPTVYCSVTEQQMPPNLVDCNRFEDANATSLYRMEQMAWEVKLDKNGRPAGFLSPEEYQKLVDAGKIEDKKGDIDLDL